MEKQDDLKQPREGLNLDIDKSLLKSTEWSFALNAILESSNGEQGFVINELGNLAKDKLPTGYLINGYCLLTDDTVVIFSCTADSSDSEIGLLDKVGRYSTIINLPCLNFSVKNQIDAEFRERIGCERTIYFTDDRNPGRIIDIDHLDLYKDSNGQYNCDLFKQFRDFKVTNIELQSISDTGGRLQLGMYKFFVRYEDLDGNPTNWICESNMVPIVSGNYNGLYSDIQGGDPLLVPPTNKSITINISNIDSRFPVYSIGVIETIGGVSTGYLVSNNSINGSTDTFTYTGVNIQNSVTVPLEDFIVSKISYYKWKHVDQIDNRLVIANISERPIDFADFQRKANEIQTNYFTRVKPAESASNSSPKTGQYYYDNRSYMRDEIYALGIVWIFKDGTETPVFHIPGRQVNKAANNTAIPNNISHSAELSGYFGAVTNMPNLHNRLQASDGINGNKGWDNAEYTPSQDSQFLPNTRNFKRWEVYNTAIRTFQEHSVSNIEAGSPWTKGEMAYWESSISYPDVLDCKGTRIYPTGKIRHHKFPDTTLEPHYLAGNFVTQNFVANGVAQETRIAKTDYNSDQKALFGALDKIVPIGLEFHNINPPAQYINDLQGYRIVRAERSQQNKSVIDKGIIHKNIKGISGSKTGYIQSHPFYLDVYGSNPKFLFDNNIDLQPYTGSLCTPISFVGPYPVGPQQIALGQNTAIIPTYCFSLHSPLLKFDKDYPSIDYIKVDRVIHGYAEKWFRDEGSYSYLNKYIDSKVPQYGFDSSTFIPNTNYLVDKQAFCDANGFVPKGVLDLDFYNNEQQETYVLHMPLNIPNPSGYVDNTGQIAIPDNTATPVFENMAYYVSAKKYKSDLYSTLDSIVYFVGDNDMKDSASSTAKIFGGDCFVSFLGVRKTKYSKFEYKYGLGVITHTYEFHEVAVFDMYAESTVNSELRHEGDLTPDANIKDSNGAHNCTEGYYPKTYNPRLITEFTDYMKLEDVCHNFYLYNLDYSKENDFKPYFPIPRLFNYCSECLNSFKHRIAVSEKSFQEDKADAYRIFKVNNYKDIPGNTGEITDLFINRDQLMISTLGSLFRQQVKPNLMETNQVTLYIGTGDILSIPPEELSTTDSGYSGSTSKWATNTSEYGTVYVNQIKGKVFLLGVDEKGKFSMSEISAESVKNWMQTYLPSRMNEQWFTLFNEDFPLNNNPANSSGIGVTSVFDVRYRRVIITKRDYRVIDESLLTQRRLYIDNQGRWTIEVGDGTQNLIPEEHPEIFENHSFSISYSFLNRQWTSFHSYIPTNYISTQSKFYSLNNKLTNNYFWEHNKGDYQKYYNSVKSHILELSFNKNQTNSNIYNTISYVSSVQEFNNARKQWLDINNHTFDEAIFYNNNQSSGKLNITVKNNVDPFASVQPQAPGEIFAFNKEKLWDISDIRDFTITNNTEPLFNSDWSAIQTDYFIDKVPNTININQNKSLFEQEMMRDKFLIGRFIFKNNNNYKMITKFMDSKSKLSPR